MPFYNTLDAENQDDVRTARGLLRLREALDQAIPAKTQDDTLLVASWNLREFGGTKHGGRTRESLFYIAEIIDHFDLVAVQEVRDDLRALDALMVILGSWWKYIVTDVTVGTQGNGERLAFVYDQRKMAFGGLAGELAPAMMKDAEGKLASDFAFARSPYIVGFRAGWFKFTICTSHLFYGKSAPDDPQRLAEMEHVVELLQNRMKSKDRWARNAILLGDFNIFSQLDKTFAAFKRAFSKPLRLEEVKTNQSRNRTFDQIGFLARDPEVQLENADGGAFDYYQHVYRDQDAAEYGIEAKRFKDWRSYQMSDHLPIWTEVNIDFAMEYLGRKADPSKRQSSRPVVQPNL